MKHLTKNDVPEPFTPHSGDKVKMILGSSIERGGSSIPEIVSVKRSKVEYYKSIGWMTLADFHRKKYCEQQKLLNSYDKMFKYLDENS